jgi:translation initiation factor IF-3
MITEDADPPVVRLISFSKYKYELEKSAKQKQKASKGCVFIS